MISIAAQGSTKLFVMQLEDRCLPTTLPWPVAAESNLGILATYGQFLRGPDPSKGGIHFHEGLDIIVAADTEVRAIQAGKVIYSTQVGDAYARYVSILSSDGTGWNYLHTVPTVNENDEVVQGALIGKVAAAPAGEPFPTHLHIDATGGKDPSLIWRLLRPIDDPLAKLTSIEDTTAPTVGDIHFMRGEDDTHNLTEGIYVSMGTMKQLQKEVPRLETHGYFKGQDHSKALIVGHRATATTKATGEVGGSSNIDIIANATDKIKATDNPVGIRSIEFKAAGQLVGKTIDTVQPFNFVGQFVWDPNQPLGTQTYEALRISDLTRVPYANDYTSPSQEYNPRSYFHIVTNTDGANHIVDLADRKRYWRSKVTQGAAWNDINSTEAVNNAKGAFPDDYYDITVTARDAAGNATAKTQRVLLDNWPQNLTLVQKPGVPGTYILTGVNFTASAYVPIWLVYRDPTMAPTDGENLEAIGAFYGYAQTDVNGNIQPFEITSKIPGHYHVVADYGSGDVTFQSRLDGHSQTPEDEQGFVSIAGGSLVAAAVLPSTPATPPSADGVTLFPQILLPAPDEPAAFHGTRADTPAVSKLAVAVPGTPADPLALPGDFDG